jgi:putative transposase
MIKGEKMEVVRGAKYRLYPNSKQKSLLHNLLGSTRFIYNLFLGKIQESYFGTSINKKTGEFVPKIPSEFDLSKALTLLKSEYPFLYSVPNDFLQAESKNLSSAYKKFFANGGYPNFKSRKDKHQSINFYAGSRAKFDSEYIYLPVASGSSFQKEDFKIKYKKHKTNFSPRGKITGYIISKDNLDNYWISFTFKTESRKLKSKRKSVGIDLGIKDFIILSDGTKFKNDNLLKKNQTKLKRKQRELSRKKRGSNNYKKQNLKLSKLHRKVQNQRQYRNHYISKKLIDIYSFIGLESLSVLQIMSKENKGMKGLRNAVSNASWFDFCSKLKYKMAESQGHLIQIDRYFPSTKLCFNCGTIRDIDLSERIYTCECGYQEDRDINAAKNILAEAKRLAS